MDKKKTFRERFASIKYFSQSAILAADSFVSAVCTFLVLIFLRYVLSFEEIEFDFIWRVSLLSFVISIVSFLALGTFRNIIRYATLQELWRIGVAVFLDTLLMFVILLLMNQNDWLSMLVFLFIDAMLTLLGLLAMRVMMAVAYSTLRARSNLIKTLVYGVEGDSVAILNRLNNNKEYGIVGFCDYGDRYQSYRLAGLPVYTFTGESDFLKIVKDDHIRALVFPDEKSAQKERDRLVRFAEKGRLKIFVVPQLSEMDDRGLFSGGLREIKIEDLLGREEIKISYDIIRNELADKVVMVTGSAGSIGSELCRQLVKVGIRKLIMLDSAETPTHELRLKFNERYPDLDFVPVIGDVRNKRRMEAIFRLYRPQIVFHAADYKHVPLMEENPCEAILVNVIGTRNITDFSIKYGVEKVVMISTDKAVNPTNVMGASKRLAEIYVQSAGIAIQNGTYQLPEGAPRQGVDLSTFVPKTKFITTRFGNVLGSNGSVIPRFREQIAKGGPVTVTDERIVRFFMTIPEACRLVLEAASIGVGNEIFVFDMGDPVKIVDLARQMITLSGYTEEEIPIIFTGLRPGEKLYEEVLATAEDTHPTSHPKIRRADVRTYVFDEIHSQIMELKELASDARVEDTVRMMKQIIPEYISQNSVFCLLDKKEQK